MNDADAVVFTGGIGENSPEVRARICDGLQWIGIEVDEELNRSHTGGREGLISREGSRPSVYVIPTDEELLIQHFDEQLYLWSSSRNDPIHYVRAWTGDPSLTSVAPLSLKAT